MFLGKNSAKRNVGIERSFPSHIGYLGFGIEELEEMGFFR